MTKHYSGFALPVIMILSLAATLIGLSITQTISSAQINNVDQRFTRLAEEAAEAGTAYATYCLNKSSNQVLWTDENKLTPKSDCEGKATNSQYPAYVKSADSSTGDTVRTYFEVGTPDSQNSTNSIQIRATGKVEVVDPSVSPASVKRTFTSIQRKTIVYIKAVQGQRSASGTQRTCGILSKSVYCWGQGYNGQLGNNKEDSCTVSTNSYVCYTPVSVKRLPASQGGIGSHPVGVLSAGNFTTCLATEDTGEVFCWGTNNNDGRLGQGGALNSPASSAVPLKVTIPGNEKVTQLSVSTSICALTVSGKLFCWGSNNRGQVGDNTTISRSSPVQIGGSGGGYGALANKTVTSLNSVGGSGEFTCAVADGYVYCWGSNKSGQLGSGLGPSDLDKSTVPRAVSTSGELSSKTVSIIAADGADAASTSEEAQAHVCAIASDAKAYCWGSNTNGSIGNNGATCDNCSGPAYYYSSPTAVYATGSGVLSGKTISEISANIQGSCAIGYSPSTPDNTAAYCWGVNRGSTSGTYISAVPTAVNTSPFPSGAKIDQLTGGAARSCVRANSSLYCWGANSYGQIGDGTTKTAKNPTKSYFLPPQNSQFVF